MTKELLNYQMNNDLMKKKLTELTERLKRRDKSMSQDKMLIEKLNAEKEELQNLNE